jgi:hypothetical protein
MLHAALQVAKPDLRGDASRPQHQHPVSRRGMLAFVHFQEPLSQYPALFHEARIDLLLVNAPRPGAPQ